MTNFDRFTYFQIPPDQDIRPILEWCMNPDNYATITEHHLADEVVDRWVIVHDWLETDHRARFIAEFGLSESLPPKTL